MTKSETKENLEQDLKELILKSRINPNRVGVHSESRLLEYLFIYIVKRDGKVLEHGIKVGKDQTNVG